jgi:hypothetical protein
MRSTDQTQATRQEEREEEERKRNEEQVKLEAERQTCRRINEEITTHKAFVNFLADMSERPRSYEKTSDVPSPSTSRERCLPLRRFLSRNEIQEPSWHSPIDPDIRTSFYDLLLHVHDQFDQRTFDACRLWEKEQHVDMSLRLVYQLAEMEILVIKAADGKKASSGKLVTAIVSSFSGLAIRNDQH